MVMHIRETIPARVRREAPLSGACPESIDLVARRFMGVLLHPVPMSEMQQRCHVGHRGTKVVVDWPRDAQRCPVDVGDELELGDATYSIRGVQPHGCYLDLYIDEV